MLKKLDLDKPIVMVGMMGCGKTIIGKELANDLNIAFYDIDAMIVAGENKSINDIFADQGEEYFRKLEAEKILNLLDRGTCVISTGGGVLTTPKTLEMIKDKSISIWLYTDINTIYGRIKYSKVRPLLNCDDPKTKLRELLSMREHLYKQADIHIENTSNNTVDKIKEELNVKENC